MGNPLSGEIGAVDDRHDAIAAVGGVDPLIVGGAEHVAAVCAIAGSPNEVVTGNGNGDGEVAKIIVKLLGAEIRNAVPAIDIVVYRDPGKKVGDKECTAIDLARADMRCFIERIGKIE